MGPPYNKASTLTVGQALIMGLSPPPLSSSSPLVHVSPAGWDRCETGQQAP